MSAEDRALASRIGNEILNPVLGVGGGALLIQLVTNESAWQAGVESYMGAVGYTQLMPGTARDLGLRVDDRVDERLDKVKNLRGGARYLLQQLQKFGLDSEKALAAYNAGPGRVESLVRERGADWRRGLPDETKLYLSRFGYNTAAAQGAGDQRRQETGMPPEEEYRKIARRYQRDEKYRDALDALHERALNALDPEIGNEALSSEVRQQFQSLGLEQAFIAANPALAAQFKTGDAPINIVLSAVRAELNHVDESLESQLKQLVDLAVVYPELEESVIGLAGSGALLGIMERRAEFTSSQPQAAPYQWKVLDNGDVLAFNPNTSQVENIGNYPSAVNKQLMQDKAGNLIAVGQDGSQTTVIEGFGFPEIDPVTAFNFEKTQFQANSALSLAGLELQRRGIMVEAVGTDLANQIQIGAMTYEQSRLELDRVESALTQRREERAQLLKYAVNPASVRRTASGDEVTRLPFTDTLVGILNDAGSPVSASDFDLPVVRIDPDAAARDVLRSSEFTSPIPGLVSALDTSRKQIASIVGAPNAAELTARTAIDKIVGGT